MKRKASIAVYVTAPAPGESDLGGESPASMPMIRAQLFMPDDIGPDEGRVFVDLPALPPVGTRILHDGYERRVAHVRLETGNPVVSLYLDDR